MDYKKLIKVCDTVAANMENDAKEFDGKPFDGETVATYFGYQGAAIMALSRVIKDFIVDQEERVLSLEKLTNHLKYKLF